MVSKLAEILHNLVLESPTSARELAKLLSKPYSTLLREVNPYDSGAKLGLETALMLMKLTSDVEPLRLMAAELGYKLVKIEEA